MVSIRDGQLVVMAPAGEALVFGPDDVAAAEELNRALAYGIGELRHLRDQRRLRRLRRLRRR